jgi:hypothetical protein
MKIKHIKQIFLIICILFLMGFNYFSFAASDISSNTSINIDSDNDGLSDNEEALYGTDSKHADTDNDGYSDGVEIKSGYNPLVPAPGDRITSASGNINTQSATSKTSLTDTFINDFDKFITSKDGQSISAEEVKNFTDNEFADKVSPTDINTLPEADRTQIKIKSQKYQSLSDSNKKKEIQKDAADYLNQIIYLFSSNVSVQITTADEFDSFQADFLNRLSDLSSTENIAYFSDMGNRLETFSKQLETIEVPETMVDMHIKFLRIIKGALLLKNSSLYSVDDPMGKIIILTKANDLIKLFSDLATNDFSNYFKQISTN